MMDLTSYNYVLLNTSAGKDSQTMLEVVAKQAAEQGVSDRLVVIHADLGRVEWLGVKELAAEQAAHYGFELVVVSRIGGVAPGTGATYAKGEAFGDLLDYVHRRGKWPDSASRYCTSDFKRAPVRKYMTRLTAEWREQRGYALRDFDAPKCKILNCLGLRAEESPARAKRLPFSHDRQASNGKRRVDQWLPIHDWTAAQVWASIRASGVRYHYAYDLGMPRLSCRFCIFANREALLIAGKHNPGLLCDYVQVEKEINHRFKNGLALAEVQAAIRVSDDTITRKDNNANCTTIRPVSVSL